MGFVCVSVCGFALSWKFKGPFLWRFHFCTWHEIKSGRSHPTALSNISLYTLISYKCVEVFFPEMKSVAVISSVYKVQQYTNVKTGRYRTRFQNFVHTLWRFMLQRHGCSSKPKCCLIKHSGCPWKRWPSRPCVLPQLGGDAGRREGARWEPVWPRGLMASLCSCRRDTVAAQPPHRHLPLLSLSGTWGETTASLPSSASRSHLHLLMQRSLVGSESLSFSPVTGLGFPSPFSLFLLQLGCSFHRN